MRKLLVACSLPAVFGPLLGKPIDAQSQPLQPEVRLPSITRSWKRTDKEDSPEITIDEIERCLGQDVGLAREVKEVKQRQFQLEAERVGMEKVNLDLKQGALSVEKSRTELQEQMTSFQVASNKLREQLSALEKMRSSPPRSQSDLDAFNAMVKAYNADIGIQNKRRAQLLKDQAAFNKLVEKHNAAVAEANRGVAAFSERHETFQVMAVALTKKSEAYVSSCAGERRLEK